MTGHVVALKNDHQKCDVFYKIIFICSSLQQVFVSDEDYDLVEWNGGSYQCDVMQMKQL